MLVAIRSINGERIPMVMKWGLIPHWAKDDKLQYSTFNDAWSRGQRCLVVTDGFYEWKKLDGNGKLKQPYAIAMAGDEQMVMAGLWAKWKSPTNGEEVLSCTILTCGVNCPVPILTYGSVFPSGVPFCARHWPFGHSPYAAQANWVSEPIPPIRPQIREIVLTRNPNLR
jgi:SOS response associated peptidase (SRAP)